jgi:hypothetical protein
MTRREIRVAGPFFDQLEVGQVFMVPLVPVRPGRSRSSTGSSGY